MNSSPRTKDALDRFGKYLVQQSRSNLTRKNKVNRGKLYESLDYEARVMPNSISFDFLMEAYGEWVDKGRKAGKAPPYSAIREWVQQRRIQFRDNKGRFETYDKTAWAVTMGIKKNGIKPTNFYSRPFQLGFAKLPEEVVEAYALDVEDFVEYSLDKINTQYKNGDS